MRSDIFHKYVNDKRDEYNEINSELVTYLLLMFSHYKSLKELTFSVNFYSEDERQRAEEILGNLYECLSHITKQIDSKFNAYLKRPAQTVPNPLYDLKAFEDELSNMYMIVVRFVLRQEDFKTVEFGRSCEKLVQALNDYCLAKDLSIHLALHNKAVQLGANPKTSIRRLKPTFGKRGRPSFKDYENLVVPEDKRRDPSKRHYRLTKPKHKRPGRPTWEEQREYEKKMIRWRNYRNRIKETSHGLIRRRAVPKSSRS